MHPALATLPPWAAKLFPSPGRGVIDNLAEQDYHNTKALVSKSALDVIGERSLLHYRYFLDQPFNPPTDAMKLGSAFHVATLEPDLFKEKVIEMPDFGPLQSSKNRAVRDDWLKEQGPHVTVLKREQIIIAQTMGQSVRNHPPARALLRRIRAEVTVAWTDPATGLKCKCRADAVPFGFDVACDLKSARDASPAGFARACANERYHVQDAFYTEGFRANDFDIAHFAFIVCESEPPYACAVYELNDEARVRGEQLYMRELRALAKAIETDTWPGYSDKVENLALPRWATPDEPDDDVE